MLPCLDRLARRRWRELVADLESIGVLTVVDADVLGCYCQAYSSVRRADAELAAHGWIMTTSTGYAAPSPWVTIRNRALDDLRKFGAELGIRAASAPRPAAASA